MRDQPKSYGFRRVAQERNEAGQCALCAEPLVGGGTKSATGVILCSACIADEDAENDQD